MKQEHASSEQGRSESDTIKIDTSHLGARRADRVLAHQVGMHHTHFLKLHHSGQFHWPTAACQRAPIGAPEAGPSESELDASFGETFELNCPDYWTVVLPALDTFWRGMDPCTPGLEWYAVSQTLTRGRFMSEADAHRWARERLQGNPYSLRFEDWSGSED